ncbi:tetratricopeptide repeat-containing glycosyltransferase family protein [Rhodoferax sp.]|uniref:tetratricopeptide repeat-containing glycosyltransferase family protein n=1 Tax=Rhodoferax sp. TaxID=50421 RepID=UPI0025E18430|nr:tetratricopeptide repeat-containing glycosyltransferase family protein [Rhodoferax sp.]
MAKTIADAEALFFDGTQRLTAGDATGAETCLRAALALAPTLAEAHANLGLALEARGALAEAADSYRTAIRHNPTLPQTFVNLAGVLLLLRQLDGAEMACAQALRLRRDDPDTWCNLGAVYARMGLELESEEACREAIHLQPGHAKARFNLAYLLLRQGRWEGEEGGWAQFEWRDWYAALAQQLRCPRWQGEPLAGRSVLVGFEAGHGDMLQFGRYCAELKARGAGRVTLLCHPPLKRLLATLPGVDALVGFDEDVPPTDCWTPLLSLPALCQTRLDTVPAALPYLHAEPALVAAWAPRMPVHGLRVGLVWKGNPRFENDAERSLPHLDILAPLAAVPGVAFISLQKGAGEDEFAPWVATGLGPQIQDFADTAAIVAQLDLLISVDTAVAHLAGALNKPCWVLLPDYLPDWRWLTERSDSPWYPGAMRLFRQPAGSGWGPVVEAVAMELQAFAARRCDR